MDELGFNKIAGAILATALGVMMIREVPHLLMHSSAPDTPVYQVGPIAVETGGEDAKPLPFPQADWVNAMDAAVGAKAFKKCTSCHNADKGGVNGTGPNLWDIVGQNAGQRGNFKYSSAMASSGLTWDYETLDAFIAKPTKYLKGTNMNFIGEKKAEKRAAIIEYLRVASDAALPKPVAAAAEASMAEDTMKTDAMVQDQMSDKMEDTMMESKDKMIDAKDEIKKKMEAPKDGGH